MLYSTSKRYMQWVPHHHTSSRRMLLLRTWCWWPYRIVGSVLVWCCLFIRLMVLVWVHVILNGGMPALTIMPLLSLDSDQEEKLWSCPDATAGNIVPISTWMRYGAFRITMYHWWDQGPVTLQYSYSLRLCPKLLWSIISGSCPYFIGW
jgi:hypothetical protein